MLKSKGILSKFQLDFLKFFASLPDQEQFYLTGGTALAEYYLGHRLSYDLDLFTCQTDKLLAFFGRAEPRDAIDLYFLLKKTSFEVLANLASQKDTGFDLYWISISLNRTAFFLDEMSRWPVKMLMDFDPVALKQSFQELSVKILLSLT